MQTRTLMVTVEVETEFNLVEFRKVIKQGRFGVSVSSGWFGRIKRIQANAVGYTKQLHRKKETPLETASRPSSTGAASSLSSRSRPTMRLSGSVPRPLRRLSSNGLSVNSMR